MPRISPERTTRSIGASTPAGRSPASVQPRLADLALAVRVELLDLAADHRRDQRVVVELAHRLGDRELAVAQHRHAVPDLEHLLEVVRHVHDRVPLVAQLVDAREQRLGLGLRQRRGRLVEDDHARRLPEHLRDLDELARGERRLRDRRLRVQPLQPDALEHLARRRRSSRGRVIAAAGRELAHQQVLADRQVGQQAQLLVDDADAGVARLHRRRAADVAAVDLVGAAVALDGAREDLDQRALAGAVLAGEAVHLAGAQLEVDVLERLDRAVALGRAGAARRRPRGRATGRAGGERSRRRSSGRLLGRRVQQLLDLGRVHVLLVRERGARVERAAAARCRRSPSRPRRRPGSRRSTGSGRRACRASRRPAPRSPAGRSRTRRPGSGRRRRCP